MAKLIIVRGVPGSGKTTFAQETLGYFNLLCEADDYFVRPDGLYDFNPRLLNQAHAWCKAKVERLVYMGDEEVVVANPFTRLWEMQPYLDLAKKYNYEVVVYRCTGNFQNVHGVPEDKVAQMKARFEDYPGEIYV